MKLFRLIDQEETMRCSKTKLISLYFDGELSAEERALLESHINKCQECAGELEELQKIHKLFASASTFKASYGFSTRVLANIRAKETKRLVGFVHVFAKSAAGFAVLVLIVVGIILGSFLSKNLVSEKGNVVASLSLDIFAPAPPDSLGGAYLAMMEVKYEK
jgi:anti-sigma factor RsiW